MTWLTFAGMFAIAAYVLWYTRLPAVLRWAAFAPVVTSALGVLMIVTPGTRRTVVLNALDLSLPWIEQTYLWAPLGAAALRAILGRRRDAGGLFSSLDMTTASRVVREVGHLFHTTITGGTFTGNTLHLTVHHHGALADTMRYDADDLLRQT